MRKTTLVNTMKYLALGLAFGVAPATLHAQDIGTINVGGTVSATIDGLNTRTYPVRWATDNRAHPTPMVFYAFQCRAGQTVHVAATSEYTNLAVITDGTGVQLAFSRDARGQPAPISFACPTAGTYRVGAGPDRRGVSGPISIRLY